MKGSRNRIGFMQGRLSPKPADRIQCFPKATWREEFSHAKKIGFDCIELIHDHLYATDNPLFTTQGRKELCALSKEYGIAIGSICADYFMDYPLRENQAKAEELLSIANEVECPLVELPFVDQSSFSRLSPQELQNTTDTLYHLARLADTKGLKIALETDLPPVAFQKLISQFPKNIGVNFDTGNSSSLGFDARAEVKALGNRMLNIHIKDRQLGGSTVAVGTGDADFSRIFSALSKIQYHGDFILQTAPDADYLGVAEKYLKFVRANLDQYGF